MHTIMARTDENMQNRESVLSDPCLESGVFCVTLWVSDPPPNSPARAAFLSPRTWRCLQSRERPPYQDAGYCCQVFLFFFFFNFQEKMVFKNVEFPDF